MRKPDPDIYQLTVERLGVDATRAMYIDDQEINLVTARELGMRTILFDSTAQCERELVGFVVALV